MKSKCNKLVLTLFIILNTSAISAAKENNYAAPFALSANQQLVFAGGYGGNQGIGKLSYDGYFLPKFAVTREENTCYMENTKLFVRYYYSWNSKISFPCESPDPKHNNLYWSENLGAINGGYSPVNDLMYAGTIIKDMYQNWYGIDNPTGTDDGRLHILISERWDGAIFRDDLRSILLGDGNFGGVGYYVYPLTTLGIVGEVAARGFTYAHGQLGDASGEHEGIEQAFALMGGEAAKFFATGTNDWSTDIGTFKKDPKKARHYFYNPTKACENSWACHKDHVKKDKGDTAYRCGVYEKAFYLLATSPGWNTKRVFDVLVRANMKYWNRDTNFITGACGIIKATKEYAATDLRYNFSDVKAAFDRVGVDTSKCL